MQKVVRRCKSHQTATVSPTPPGPSGAAGNDVRSSCCTHLGVYIYIVKLSTVRKQFRRRIWRNRIIDATQILQSVPINIQPTLSAITEVANTCTHAKMLLSVTPHSLYSPLHSAIPSSVHSSLHSPFHIPLHSSLQQPSPPSRCLPGCGGFTPHHLCGSTGSCSSSDRQQTEQVEDREGSH